MDPERFKAWLILAPSILSTCHPLSPSEEELLPLSVGVVLFVAAGILFSEERLVALDASISRNGDCSLSDESFVMVGGGGDPSDFFDRNPAWKRLTLGFISNDDSGACGIGEEPRESFETSSDR